MVKKQLNCDEVLYKHVKKVCRFKFKLAVKFSAMLNVCQNALVNMQVTLLKMQNMYLKSFNNDNVYGLFETILHIKGNNITAAF